MLPRTLSTSLLLFLFFTPTSTTHPFISFINHSSSIQPLHHSHYNQASQTNPHPHSIQRELLPTTSPFIVTMQLRAPLTTLWLIIQFKTTQALPVDTTTTILVRRLVVFFPTYMMADSICLFSVGRHVVLLPTAAISAQNVSKSLQNT